MPFHQAREASKRRLRIERVMPSVEVVHLMRRHAKIGGSAVCRFLRLALGCLCIFEVVDYRAHPTIAAQDVLDLVAQVEPEAVNLVAALK